MDNADAPQFEPGVLSSIWRYRWLFLALVAVFTLLGYFSTWLQPSDLRWSASAVIVVEDPRSSAIFDSVPQSARGRYVANQVAVLRSTPVAQTASESLQAEGFEITPQALLGSYDVIASSGSSEVIEIVVTADSGDMAIASANRIVEAYQEVRRTEARANYQSSIEQLDAFIATTDERLDAIQAELDADASLATSEQLLQLYQRSVERLLELEGAEDVATDELDTIRAEIAAIQAALSVGAPATSIDSLIQERDTLLARRARLTQARDEIAIDTELLGSGVLLFSPAVSATEPASASPLRNTFLGLMVGVAFGAIAAYFLALRRRTFTEPSQPSAILAAPLFASVPMFKEARVASTLPILDAPASEAAESFRFAAAALRHRFSAQPRFPDGTPATGPGAGTPWVAVVSAIAGDGKTVVIANTALAAAQAGDRVLLIDADIADQSLTRLLHDAIVGQEDLLQPSDGPALQVNLIPGAHGGSVHLVGLHEPTDGAPDVTKIVSESLPRALSVAGHDDYDFVFIDVPPLLQIAYAGTIASRAGTALVVAQHGGRVADVEELRNRLDLSSTVVAGYVYNKAPRRSETPPPGSSVLAHRRVLDTAAAPPEVADTSSDAVERDDAVPRT